MVEASCVCHAVHPPVLDLPIHSRDVADGGGLDIGHEDFETRRTLVDPRRACPRSSLSRPRSADPEASCSSHRAADEASHLHDMCPRTGRAAPAPVGWLLVRRIHPSHSQHRTYAIGSHLRVSLAVSHTTTCRRNRTVLRTLDRRHWSKPMIGNEAVSSAGASKQRTKEPPSRRGGSLVWRASVAGAPVLLEYRSRHRPAADQAER
jgi:hypothetical protein